MAIDTRENTFQVAYKINNSIVPYTHVPGVYSKVKSDENKVLSIETSS